MAASLIWGFSFGLIGNILAGLPTTWLAMVRLLIASSLFLPFLRRGSRSLIGSLLLIGMLQFGLMYLLYMRSFLFLQSHEVALYTVTTPLYVTLLHDARERRLLWKAQGAALLAVAAAAIILWQGLSKPSLIGFSLVQLSNICFALGQLAYRWRCAPDHHLTFDHGMAGWLYLGGSAVLLPFAALETWRTPVAPTGQQWAAIIYLGTVASGIGFWLWNSGCRRAQAATLAVMNNLKIPSAVILSLLIFQERAALRPLLAGTLLMVVALRISTVRTKHDSAQS